MKKEGTFIGKDILRLITIAMYDNPLTLYREYIQNAVDSIDSAVKSGLKKDEAIISIAINHDDRSITIKDNGIGITSRKFSAAMTTIGQSEKVQDGLRGFWGIGRLIGLAYCRSLVFTTKAKRERTINSIEWDCVKFREILNDSTQKCSFSDAIDSISTITSTKGDASEPAFFEVKINNVIRHGNDVLFNEEKVKSYISQVAPVPFHGDAPFLKEITHKLSGHVDVSGYNVMLNEESDYVCKPYRKEFFQSASRQDKFSDIEFIEIPNRNGGCAVVGWILHHSYLGALKNALEIRGIRVRVGNMQIGSERILADIFPEDRFNSWAVGELHILDRKIRPNGQRTGWEDAPAYRDIKNKLAAAVGNAIAQKCRFNSAGRNKFRLLENKLKNIELQLHIVETNILPPKKSTHIIEQIKKDISDVSHPLQKKIMKRVDKFEINGATWKFDKISAPKRKIVKDIVEIIYDNSPNAETAMALISKIETSIK